MVSVGYKGPELPFEGGVFYEVQGFETEAVTKVLGATAEGQEVLYHGMVLVLTQVMQRCASISINR